MPNCMNLKLTVALINLFFIVSYQTKENSRLLQTKGQKEEPNIFLYRNLEKSSNLYNRRLRLLEGSSKNTNSNSSQQNNNSGDSPHEKTEPQTNPNQNTQVKQTSSTKIIPDPFLYRNLSSQRRILSKGKFFIF